MAEAKLSVSIDHWEDEAFVRAFERAIEQIEWEGLPLDSPTAADRAEALLHDAGYPNARITVSRTVDEALAHAARWTVARGGPKA